MTPRSYCCECCGAPACVHVMHEVGRPGSVRHLCLRCADESEDPDDARASLNHGAILIGIGLFILTTSILADSLRLGHGDGFGSWQVLALILALVVIACGSVLRISSLCVLGWCFLLLTLVADYAGLDGRDGFGIRQAAGTLIASLAIGAGLALGFASAHRQIRPVRAGDPAEPPGPWRRAGQRKDSAG